MRIAPRMQPILKSAAYALLALALLAFSSSFYPALQWTANTPRLTIALLACLALWEGVHYAAFIGVIFGSVEAFVFGGTPLLTAVFYLAFALFCTWLFENFFAKNFLAWLLYTAGGILLHAVFLLFFPVSAWGISAADVLLTNTLPTAALSALLSLPLFPICAWIKKKTE